MWEVFAPFVCNDIRAKGNWILYCRVLADWFGNAAWNTFPEMAVAFCMNPGHWGCSVDLIELGCNSQGCQTS